MSHKDQKACRDIIKLHGMLSCFNSKASPLENLLFNTATAIYEFFHANGYSVSRVRWDNKEVSPDLMSYCGWLYAFYGEQEYPCYVGETGRTINLRFGEHKRSAPWWPDWKNVKILPCPNKSVRKVFESLVGLAGGYYENKMQPAEADNILEDIILSLLSLGYDDEQIPEFPNQNISDTINIIRSCLDTLFEKESLENKTREKSR